MKNSPELWINEFPVPTGDSHKYSRGQVAVLGGKDMTGAACLSADAAARIGAGLVTIISPKVKKSEFNPVSVYRCFKSYIIVRDSISIKDFTVEALCKGRVCSVVGPGLGNKNYPEIRSEIISLLEINDNVVIDADGINAFADGQAEYLFESLDKNVVLTPHEGEFKKLFPDLVDVLENDRMDAANRAAEISNAVIVLKGAKTVVAAKGRKAVINDMASPYLATAGSGDVLSGAIAGLIAQGMSAFDAACAAAWIHGKSAENLGVGLVASDLVEIFPKVLKEMLGIHKKLG